MIKVRIGNEKSTVIDFPCSDNVLNEKLKEIGVGEQIPSRATITEVLEPKDLPLKLHLIHNLDEMNYLAKRLDSFTPHEMDTFMEMVKTEEYYMPYDFINATFNLQCYALFQDVSSMEKVGKEYMFSKRGCISQSEIESTDFAALGKERLNNGEITITDHGLLCKVDGAEINQVYNGTTFPEYDYTGSSLITVELSYYDNTEYLYLPDDDWAIVKAVARLGANSVDDCKCHISDISTDVGGTNKMLNNVLEYEDLFAVNKVTSYINNADMDLKKLQALIEYADATDSTTICVLADRIDDFTFIEDIEDDEDIAKYFVENDEDYSVSAELEDFIKYDELGEHLREEMDGKFGEHGYVSMNNQVDTLEQILEEYSGQIRGVTMGGI